MVAHFGEGSVFLEGRSRASLGGPHAPLPLPIAKPAVSEIISIKAIKLITLLAYIKPYNSYLKQSSLKSLTETSRKINKNSCNLR